MDDLDEIKKTIDDLNLELPSDFKFKGRSRERLGLSTQADPPLPVRPLKRFFITVALPHKDKVLFNNKRVEYRMLKTVQQYYYLRRVQHLLNDITADYLLVFEHCDSGDLHCHITCSYRGILKDLRLDVMNFFTISSKNCYAVIVKEIYDEEHLRTYMLEKDKKKYQTSTFPPIEKHIDEFN